MPPATSLWYGHIAHISQTDWYGICTAIALASWLVRWLLGYSPSRPFCHFDMLTFNRVPWSHFCSVNILPLALRARSWVTVRRRAAKLAVAHGCIDELAGWSSSTPLHGAIAILNDDQPVPAIRQHYVPSTACFMILIFPVTLHVVVRRHPQLAMKCHYHSGSTGLASMSAMRGGCPWPSIVVFPGHELLRMDITVPSRWKVELGQYVYLWLPHAGLCIAGQLLLFYIASWKDARAGGSCTLHVLVRPQSSAFAVALYKAKRLYNVRKTAPVLGPYGRPPGLAHFRTVLLIVEDVEIVRVFSLTQTRVLASEQHHAVVRKLIVVWKTEDLVNMQHLLDLDRQEAKNEPFHKPGTRLRSLEGSLDVAQTMRECLNTRQVMGIRQSIRNQVKAIVQPDER
ncbi:hypothetical protein P170DRAFT_447974 [Aspergillus steynii IBT 23096]|uniref:FAD-binding 8 domain-containing protein n=1 Tax=Aspergillus steynii IBT 23096 TaxID=1392250 RepID=A0A2I2G5P3_9EURO|nr:uncharacterized protein P170DRAFT_447974 [Aspergillus steynii IBT 23096]PLB48201.1 hypothetical protein P170DRAFT_447974 [Aspergillus steynii IBT 23096]